MSQSQFHLSQSQQSEPTPTQLPVPQLPVAQLESLRFKANQIIESIIALQLIIEVNGMPLMPAWPDILSKYNILLSQTHNFSTSLIQPLPSAIRQQQQSGQTQPSMFERIALHPRSALPDAQLDSEVVPLLRNQQTTQVLQMENDTVRRLAEHMKTRGSLGVLGIPSASTTNVPAAPAPQTHHPYLNGFHHTPKKPEYHDVLAECQEISSAHDRRVERAVRAVTMLRDKFGWKQRVEVEVEEPEELEWDPRLGPRPGPGEEGNDSNAPDGNADIDSDDDDSEDEGDNDEDMHGGTSDEDEVNVEGALVDSGGMEGEGEGFDGLFSPTNNDGSPASGTSGMVNGTSPTSPSVPPSSTADVPMDGIS